MRKKASESVCERERESKTQYKVDKRGNDLRRFNSRDEEKSINILKRESQQLEIY